MGFLWLSRGGSLGHHSPGSSPGRIHSPGARGRLPSCSRSCSPFPHLGAPSLPPLPLPPDHRLQPSCLPVMGRVMTQDHPLCLCQHTSPCSLTCKVPLAVVDSLQGWSEVCVCVCDLISSVDKKAGVRLGPDHWGQLMWAGTTTQCPCSARLHCAQTVGIRRGVCRLPSASCGQGPGGHSCV